MFWLIKNDALKRLLDWLAKFYFWKVALKIIVPDLLTTVFSLKSVVVLLAARTDAMDRDGYVWFMLMMARIKCESDIANEQVVRTLRSSNYFFVEYLTEIKANRKLLFQFRLALHKCLLVTALGNWLLPLIVKVSSNKLMQSDDIITIQTVDCRLLQKLVFWNVI